MRNGRKRESYSIFIIGCSHALRQSLLRGRATLALLSLPAAIYGCMPSTLPEGLPAGRELMTVEAATRAPASASLVDVFVFNDDRKARLDAYQRFFLGEPSREDAMQLKIASTRGPRIVFAVANPGRDRMDWADVSCLGSMDKKHACLAAEDPASPLMTASCRMAAGDSAPAELCFVPLLSQVCLSSLSCDFTGTGYAGEKLRGVRAYLTNVCSEYPLAGGGVPRSYVNSGMLDMASLSGFAHPELLVQEAGRDIGRSRENLGITLGCYPNTVAEDGLGTPFTRLVIEAEIAGVRWYYPIDINRAGPGLPPVQGTPGVAPDCRYSYDVVIRRTGCSDPDTPIGLQMADVRMKVKEWEVRDEQTVLF